MTCENAQSDGESAEIPSIRLWAFWVGLTFHGLWAFWVGLGLARGHEFKFDVAYYLTTLSVWAKLNQARHFQNALLQLNFHIIYIKTKP